MSNFALQIARRFEPRHLAIALAAVIASFAFLDLVYRHALDSLVAFHLDDSDPAARNSFPAVVMGLMLLGAGALSLAVARMRETHHRGWWRAAAVVLVFFAVEEALGLHTWLERHLEVSWNVVYLPFVAIAAIVWFETARLMAGNRGAQLAFAGGIAGWLLAALLDAARTGRAEALMAGELVEMAAAALLLLGMFSFARSCSLAERPAADAGESTLAIAVAAVHNVNARALVAGLGLFAILFTILGSIVYPGGGDLRVFDLNKEQTFPATFSGALLLAAGGLALLNGLVRSRSAADRRWWIVLALVFAFLGLDEIAALHEAIQDRVNVWGQAVLAPIVVVGIYAWWVALRQLRNQPPAATLFLAGAGAWIVSQLIDAGFNEHWGWTVVPEEVFEMVGSALFGLALLVALQQLVAPAAAAVTASQRPAARDARVQQVPAATR